MAEITVAVRAPSALLRVFGSAPSPDPEPGPNCPVSLGGGAFALLPLAGDPAVFDAALTYGASLLNEAAGSGSLRREGLRLFVSPVEIEWVGGEVARWVDDLAEDLEGAPPAIAGGAVCLTSHAAAMLEDSWRLTPQPAYRRRSGKEVPLLRAEGSAERVAPWRNPEVLGRHVPWLPRPETEERLRERSLEPLLRIAGPLGCGKTRLAHEFLSRQGIPHLTLRAQAARHATSLAWQLARELLTPPVAAGRLTPHFASDADRRLATQRWQEVRETTPAKALAALLGQAAAATGRAIVVVCDDAEKIESEDRELLAEVASESDAAVRFWLIGRPGGTAPAGFEDVAKVWVGPFEADERQRFATELTRGWAVPEPLLDAWSTATAGHAFALEEGLLALARAQRLRHSWGSFFYAGDEGELPAYRPSVRLVAHLQSEAARLGLVPQLFALAVAETPLPASEIDAALGLGGDGPSSWENVAVQAGLVRRVPGAWGLGLRLTCAAYGRALEFGLTPEASKHLRQRLGAELAAGATEGRRAWHTYRLLRGTPAAIQPLLKSARGAPEPGDAKLMEALASELAALRARGADRETEILLLWRLFQAARRLGRVHEVGAELERALELARDEPDRFLALVNLKAESEQEAGRFRDAERTLVSGLEATSSLPRPERRASLMIRLGRTYQQAGRFAEAERLFEEIYPALDRQGFRELAASCRYHLGNLARRAHRLPESLAHHGAALEVRRELALPLDTCASLTALGSLSAALGNYPKALHYYDEALALANASPTGAREVAYALLGKARVLGRAGDAVGATPLLRQARELREGRDDRPGETIVRLALAENLFDLGQDDRAFEEAGQARFHLELLSLNGFVADADQLLGRIQLRRRRFEEAQQHLGTAREGHLRAEEPEAVAFDEAWLLEAALLTEQLNTADRAVRALVERRSRLARPELGERLDYRLYRALDWLASRGLPGDDPRAFLERAYEQVLAKAGHLVGDLRHRFLLEVPSNREIVEAATRMGITS